MACELPRRCVGIQNEKTLLGDRRSRPWPYSEIIISDVLLMFRLALFQKGIGNGKEYVTWTFTAFPTELHEAATHWVGQVVLPFTSCTAVHQVAVAFIWLEYGNPRPCT